MSFYNTSLETEFLYVVYRVQNLLGANQISNL